MGGCLEHLAGRGVAMVVMCVLPVEKLMMGFTSENV